jgi:hypothetical protein
MRDERFKKIACTVLFHMCSTICSVTEQKSYTVFTNYFN